MLHEAVLPYTKYGSIAAEFDAARCGSVICTLIHFICKASWTGSAGPARYLLEQSTVSDQFDAVLTYLNYMDHEGWKDLCTSECNTDLLAFAGTSSMKSWHIAD